MEKEIYRDSECQRNYAPSSQVVQKKSDNQNFNQRKSKFSRGQKEAMRAFADSLGWSMRNRGREEEINRFCERIDVSRFVFKTWMNNNKKFYFNCSTATTSGA